jgi:hypothetical protein
MRGLGRVSISVKGGLQFQPRAPIPSGEPNLFFEQLTPVLFPYGSQRCRNQQHSKEKNRSTGLGETITETAETIPGLTIQLPRREVILTSVPFRDRRPADVQFEDGVIGLDVLGGGFDLDFRSMQLVLDTPLP